MHLEGCCMDYIQVVLTPGILSLDIIFHWINSHRVLPLFCLLFFYPVCPVNLDFLSWKCIFLSSSAEKAAISTSGTMEECVQFRNVGCSYFPQSRVDCHYTISSQHTWASNDWVGLFKVCSPHRIVKSPPISMLCNTLWTLSSSGGVVVGEGLPHVRLGSCPTQL